MGPIYFREERLRQDGHPEEGCVKGLLQVNTSSVCLTLYVSMHLYTRVPLCLCLSIQVSIPVCVPSVHSYALASFHLFLCVPVHAMCLCVCVSCMAVRLCISPPVCASVHLYPYMHICLFICHMGLSQH